jgi:DNA (cytosine-5)-methyltransferase 1
MNFSYISVCSGIEATTVAWEDLGWKAKAFAEIEKFPNQVLSHHYPNIPNVGDFTKIQGDEYGSVDLLVGGTPCQDFSVAGLRAGLDGQRGQLAIEFARLAARLRSRWLVWENVPGVLSIEGGRAFGTFLATLGKFGYGFAYRILDAQYFGVPQRRRRVFVVGYLGDWRPAAAVLLEREAFANHTKGSNNKRRSFPVLSCRNAGNANARGLVLYQNGNFRACTPEEEEARQGFPKGYTRVNKSSDTQRYKALGNSMAVPVMLWIGQRIELVETMIREEHDWLTELEESVV